MRIDVRNPSRERVGRIDVDPETHPTRARLEGDEREVYLNWDSAIDDAGNLRRCVVCGSHAMFRTRNFPQMTLLVVIVAFTGAIIGMLGYATNPLVLGSLVVVLVLDVCILLFSRRQLVCYRCRSTYTELPIARYHRRWDRREAERHPPQDAQPAVEPPGEPGGLRAAPPVVAPRYE